jgi:hypothetical protein
MIGGRREAADIPDRAIVDYCMVQRLSLLQLWDLGWLLRFSPR